MIILLDIDGVLIRNHAYSAALKQTVAYFARRMGLGEITLTQSDIEVFESQSITIEWDSSAISLAALFMERLRVIAEPANGGKPTQPLPPDFWEALDEMAAEPVSIAHLDFSAVARRVGEATPPGDLPSHAALALFLEDLQGLPLNSGKAQAASLLHHMLADCYNIDHAPAMQIFQNYAIGHAEYAQYYGLPPRFESEPLLEKLDRTYLNAEMRERLLAKRDAREIYPVIYTARPSLAPIEAGANLRGYTPEAEIARKISGIDPVPVTGFGKVDWMAKQVGLSGRDLVKPSPMESMAAMGIARTGQEVESLKAALAVERGDHLRYPLTICASETVHVFEDSPSSLRAVTRAVEKLNRQGLNLRLVRHGIAPEGSPKRAALAAIADLVHNDVNDGLEQIL